MPLKTLDLFCGAGGSSAGARLAGAQIACAIDMSPIATATFKANFPAAKVITARLEDVDPTALRHEIGEIDILLASPECTNHSCAKGAAPRDEASRATAMQVVRFARAFEPRWLVLENVVHMRPWARYNELKVKLKALGYSMAEQILNASDFGVPQSRRRLFLVGDRNFEPGLVNVVREKKPMKARSILDNRSKWSMTPLFAPSRAKATIGRARRAIGTLGPRTGFLLVYYGTDGSGGWQPLNRPLRTVTTIDRFALVVRTSQGPKMRMLQVPELKRAMGFSDAFELPVGTRRERIRLLGNGVCPPVMRYVVAALVNSPRDR